MNRLVAGNLAHGFGSILIIQLGLGLPFKAGIPVLDGYHCSHTVTDIGTMQTLSVPSALTAVEEEAFRGLDSAQVLLAGESLTDIGAYAFADMASLELAILPSAGIRIDETAFAGSSPLIVCAEGSEAQTYAEAHGLAYISQ